MAKKRKPSPPLRKSRKAVKKPAKAVKVRSEKEEELTLFDKVRRETESWGGGGRGKKRDWARTAYFLWRTLPVRYRGAPDQILNTLGLSGDMLELARIGSIGAFGDMFDVGHGTLASWGKEFEDSDEAKDTRGIFRGLMREAVAALYRKLIENGDADRFKTFAAYVEGWVPTMALQLPSTDGDQLTDEEKASLDRLIAENTKP